MLKRGITTAWRVKESTSEVYNAGLKVDYNPIKHFEDEGYLGSLKDDNNPITLKFYIISDFGTYPEYKSNEGPKTLITYNSYEEMIADFAAILNSTEKKTFTQHLDSSSSSSSSLIRKMMPFLKTRFIDKEYNKKIKEEDDSLSFFGKLAKKIRRKVELTEEEKLGKMNEEIRNNLLEEYTLKDLLDVLIPVLTTAS